MSSLTDLNLSSGLHLGFLKAGTGAAASAAYRQARNKHLPPAEGLKAIGGIVQVLLGGWAPLTSCLLLEKHCSCWNTDV